VFDAKLAFKESSKALYALANASCFQSGTSHSFPFSRRSSTREKTGKDGVTRQGKQRQEKHFPSLHLLFCFICCFLAVFSHSTSFSFLGAFNAHGFVFTRRKSRCNILFSIVLCFRLFSFHFCARLSTQVDLYMEKNS